MSNDFYNFMYDVHSCVTEVRTLRKVAQAEVLDIELRTRAESKLAAAEKEMLTRLAPYAKAMGMGAAAATPALAGGAALASKAKRDAEDFRNKSLMGAAAVGTGLVAMNHASKKSLREPQEKVAEDHAEIATKLAAVFYLDHLLSELPESFSGFDVESVRAENAKHAADLILALV